MEEENPLIREFKEWTSQETGIPIKSLRRIVYQCGDVGLVCDGIGEVMHMNYYLEYLNTVKAPQTPK